MGTGLHGRRTNGDRSPAFHSKRPDAPGSTRRSTRGEKNRAHRIMNKTKEGTLAAILIFFSSLPLQAWSPDTTHRRISEKAVEVIQTWSNGQFLELQNYKQQV